ncbi:phage tail spike protein [Terrisporobacter mayombei]|uniref:Tail spike domain-containing protein n=1 Tax=Terrisporobacter mayombei TaxID=1541 RepID=A0ABY9PXC1_9FIRM|nr:phage tail spike protein [Terrisporobacter mayombei]MCC3870293.1 phage tail protein [Terrisporobacter mayombei]WMT79918.1 hypothetical protein TEMA_01890 [Terrisporobacter mayombei]
MRNQICDTIFVMDPQFNVIGILSNNGAFPNAPFFDDIYVQELATGAETYEFSTFSNAITSEILQLGNYIVFKYGDKYKLFQIMDNDDEHKENQTITCYCEMAGLELLTDYCEPFFIEGNVQLFFNTVLQDTNWKLGKYSQSLTTNIQQVRVEKYTNVYKVIQENIETYGNIEIEFRVEFNGNTITGFYIDVYENEGRGNKTYKRFEYGENVEGIKRNRNMYDFASAMIGTGQNGITFKDIEWKKSEGKPANKPKGQDFIVDLGANERFNKRGKYIKGLYGSDDTNPQDLLLHSWEKLQEVKEPKFDYEVDLALTDTEFEEISIGDTNYVIDYDYNPPILLECRVGKLEISLTNVNESKCTLSNYKEIKSKIKTLSKDDIMKDVLAYVNSLKPGLLTSIQINTLKSYLRQLDIEESEIDAIIEELKKIAYDKFQKEERHKVYGENVDIKLNEGRNYYCDDVVSYIKFTAPAQCKTNYSTTLVFTTDEGVPTKVNQDNNIWLTGSDCINGGLLIKCDSTYTIKISLDNNVTTPRKFKGTVSKVSHGGTYRAYENKTKYRDNVLELLETYYEKRDLFIYSTTTPYSFKNPCTSANIAKWASGGFHIDCSTLTQFAARGITYINSTYNHNDKSPYYLSTKYKYSYEVPRFAADQAKYCIEQGWQLELDVTNRNDWKKLKPGDLVFWKQRFGEEGSNATVDARFMQVGHVAIVRAINEQGIPHTYEATSGTPCIRNRLLTSNYPEKMLFFARPRK